MDHGTDSEATPLLSGSALPGPVETFLQRTEQYDAESVRRFRRHAERAAGLDASVCLDQSKLDAKTREWLDGPPALRSERARNGARTVRAAAVLMHSAIDPVREAQRAVDAMASKTTGSNVDAVVCFGFGAAHVLCRARNALPDAELHVVVPDERELFLALLCHDAAWWAALDPVDLWPAASIGTLPRELQRRGIRTHVVNVLRAAAELHPHHVRRFTDTMEQFRSRREVNSNTVKRFGHAWVRNLLDNVPLLTNAHRLDALTTAFARQFAGGPPPIAVVCGAGPTLERFIPHCANVRDHAIIVAVDTAAARMVQAGLQPDIVVVMDPQYWNSRHLDAVFPSGAALITEPAVHPRVVRHWRGPIYLAASLFPLGEILFPRARRLGAGGSVATSAWDVGRLLGANPIYMAGVDLGFPNGDTHCRGSFFEHRALTAGLRTRPAETHAHAYLTGVGLERVPAADGMSMLSDPRMAVYRGWFAEQQRMHAGQHTVLLDGDSSAIEGIPHAEPHAVFESARIRERIDEALVTARQSQGAPDNQLDGPLLHLVAQLESMAALARSGQDACRAYAHSFVETSETLARLEATDAALRAHPLRDIAGFLAWNELEGAGQTRAESLQEAIQTSRRIYAAIIDSCEFQIAHARRIAARR